MDQKIEKINIKENKSLLFVKEVAKYFMDFLETDFHKRKTPRRNIKFKNDSNLLVGVNLEKYQNFNKLVIGAFNEAFLQSDIKVKKGEYKANIPKNLLDLIKIKVEDIEASDIQDIIKKIAGKLQKHSEVYHEEYDRSLVSSLESVSDIFRNNLVSPFIEKIEKSLENISLGDENTKYLMEEELTDVFLGSIENKITELLKLLVSDKEVDLINEIGSVLGIEEIKAIIIDFFDDFKIADLFSEILEINRNRNILDKQDFYLYFCDVTYNRAKYPIFYIPFEVEVKNDTVFIALDSRVYINKKALEFIVQEYNKEMDVKGGLKADTERIIYLAQGKDNLMDVANGLISEIINYFELSDNIHLINPVKQRARSKKVFITNSCYVSLFDKSDEALVNDYEDILQLLSAGGGVLGEMFNKLVDDFINKEPKVYNLEIDENWDEFATAEKLVIETPIPLNSEQRKIVAALNKEDCKYIAVQGPPGTGKSHTITALVCNAILDNKNVLVLSDKKEALDVVEDKITGTMNKVRTDKHFQNPILRLGKTGNTYSQILSTTSVENIRNNYKAVKKNYSELESNISKTVNSLKEDIEAETLVYEDIDQKEIIELTQYEKHFEKNIILVNEDEVMKCADAVNDLEELRNIFLRFKEVFNEEKNDYVDFLIFHGVPTSCFENIENFSSFLRFLKLLEQDIAGIKEGKEYNLNRKSILIFKDFSSDKINQLENFLERYQALKSSVFGYLFKKKKVEQLNSEFFKIFGATKINEPQKKLNLLEEALNVFRFIKSNDKSSFGLDYVRLVHHLLTNEKYNLVVGEFVRFIDDVNFIQEQSEYQETFKLIGFKQDDFDTYYNNKLTEIPEKDFTHILRYIFLKQKIQKSFSQIPKYSYVNQIQKIEDLVTAKMTYLMDGRLINFYENNKGTAIDIRKIIRAKNKFEKDKFENLKEAFPCILAGIRDYAEYIPLEPEIFDLVIIDEASQVSVAQAFPALIRAKQVVIMGDKKQFSNVKATQAKTETNLQYINDLEISFKKNVSKEITKLERLKKFNIKTSILEFFETISNFDIQLRKHFRGYKELISYSNHFFYSDTLQVMKIRGKSIDEVLKMTVVDHDGRVEAIPKTNKPEIEFIKEELAKIKDGGKKQSVGIITPHTNQQKILIDEISKLTDKDYYFNELDLKIMTFDTCQGEERDVIFYSMVATKESDRLWGVFIKDLEAIDIEEDGKIRAQRLNVGFSRAKECIHLILSKEPEEYKGSIRDALLHYKNEIEKGKKEPTPDDVDNKSPMEKQVLNWLTQTKLWRENAKNIELKPQFQVGSYLKQLDSNYDHPSFIVDFLLIYREDDNRKHNIIIEYDGFKEHFENLEAVNEFNFESHYSDDDVYRQKVLEGYGYKFLRINKFNIGDNPIETLDKRIEELIKNTGQQNSFLESIHSTIEGLENGDYKECPKCKEVKEIAKFKDKTLISGVGRICNDCKGASICSTQKNKAVKPLPVLSSQTCPRCGARMILRGGRFGKFYGCSKYPYCRGTRKY
ncbi:MAG: AAA domain-containing protein [Candidatus Falkowbacteria bacterium]